MKRTERTSYYVDFPQPFSGPGIGAKHLKVAIFADTQDFVFFVAYDLINVSDLKDLEHPLVGIDLTSVP